MDKRGYMWLRPLILLLIFLPMDVFASWMWLGSASLGATYPDRITPTDDLTNVTRIAPPLKRPRRPKPVDMTSPSFCRKVPGLVRSQRRLCQRSRDILSGISEGAKLAIFECQRQFKTERWNCSTNINLENPFGSIIDLGTKETGFAYAITSAGVVHAIARACSEGNITDCTCYSPKGRPGKANVETLEWQWGGCSDNVHYAIRIARKFVDAGEENTDGGRKAKSKMNLHNNELGRQAIDRQMKLECRCHGISSSCALKTCWKTLPRMSKVGDFIKARYQESIHVIYKEKKNKLKPTRERNERRRIKKDSMVHIARSPSFCRGSPEQGILGTRGRECNRTHDGADSCNRLCCGRGYNRQEERIVNTKCNCEFIWCCKVKCQTCEYVREVSTCK
uniref:Protein Wnt n=1 Tax=Holothuria glaberrima TaxID=31192 RepID=A0AA48P7H3_HOLGL|nr:TPA_inf: Wnt16 [Holothuria glaberrima]